eukprot:2714253-Pleurochrysis_carterae.AAC.2
MYSLTTWDERFLCSSETDPINLKVSCAISIVEVARGAHHHLLRASSRFARTILPPPHPCFRQQESNGFWVGQNFGSKRSDLRSAINQFDQSHLRQRYSNTIDMAAKVGKG